MHVDYHLYVSFCRYLICAIFIQKIKCILHWNLRIHIHKMLLPWSSPLNPRPQIQTTHSQALECLIFSSRFIVTVFLHNYWPTMDHTAPPKHSKYPGVVKTCRVTLCTVSQSYDIVGGNKALFTPAHPHLYKFNGWLPCDKSIINLVLSPTAGLANYPITCLHVTEASKRHHNDCYITLEILRYQSGTIRL